MHKQPLTTLARQHLQWAIAAASGRSAHTVHGGQDHALRQTLVALRAGSKLDDHENPGDATIQVLQGHVTLVAKQARWTGSTGDLLAVPDARHSLEAIEDSVILLTVARRPESPN